MKVGYVYDPVYLKHDTGQHPENAGRLEAIISHLEQTGLIRQLTLIQPRAASIEELSLVHSGQHISRVQEVGQGGGGQLDADTVMSPGSYDAALYAAGGVIRASEAVIQGEVDSAFALVRPPGHHATSQRAMGFCLPNMHWLNITWSASLLLTLTFITVTEHRRAFTIARRSFIYQLMSHLSIRGRVPLKRPVGMKRRELRLTFHYRLAAVIKNICLFLNRLSYR